MYLYAIISTLLIFVLVYLVESILLYNKESKIVDKVVEDKRNGVPFKECCDRHVLQHSERCRLAVFKVMTERGVIIIREDRC